MDRLKRKTYHYVVNSGGRNIGTIRIDRFATEDKLIYKAILNMPFAPQYTEYRSRLNLDHKYNLESYTKERIANKVADVLYLENFKNTASFVSKFQSRFACVDN
ncbi:MAG: hypothetical protein NC933_06085, partial [Candidatus Omnitrophica bacterium]|nr:hypothetical protein [Candidatus Omnitrophota bacterium]